MRGGLVVVSKNEKALGKAFEHLKKASVLLSEVYARTHARTPRRWKSGPDKERIEDTARKIIQFINECEIVKDQSPLPIEKGIMDKEIERVVIDRLWRVYHLKSKSKTPTG